MARPQFDQELVLEVGGALLLAGVVAGTAVYLASHLAGTAYRGRRQAAPSPPPGSVPANRHQHIQSNSAR